MHHNASLLQEEDILFLEFLPESITFQLDVIKYGMTHLYKEYEEIVSFYAFEDFRKTKFGVF